MEESDGGKMEELALSDTYRIQNTGNYLAYKAKKCYIFSIDAFREAFP